MHLKSANKDAQIAKLKLVYKQTNKQTNKISLNAVKTGLQTNKTS